MRFVALHIQSPVKAALVSQLPLLWPSMAARHVQQPRLADSVCNAMPDFSVQG